MSHFDRSSPTVDRPEKPKKVGSRLSQLGDRLARTFQPVEVPDQYASPQPAGDEFSFPGEVESPWERIAARFPIARNGYDRDAVDRHISELERQISDLKSGTSTNIDVAAEINRIGEQTSTILMAAHEQAQEITRRAKSQADHCIAEAASRAMGMTQQAEQRLRDLDGETEAIWSERAQLIDDVRSLAGALATLAEESAKRFPPEPEEIAPPPATPSAATVPPEVGTVAPAAPPDSEAEHAGQTEPADPDATVPPESTFVPPDSRTVPAESHMEPPPGPRAFSALDSPTMPIGPFDHESEGSATGRSDF